MGNTLSSLFDSLFRKKEARILMLGLDNAGKTSILSIGFNVETLEFNNIQMQVWDLGGQKSIRPYWRSYYQRQEALIFVVDSTDAERLPVAKEELLSILQEEELKDAVICIFANKQDLPDALEAAAVAEALGLNTVDDRTWTIIPTSATKGGGLADGLTWLSSNMRK